MVDRGADLSRFSQYAHEREVCFPPLTGIEVLDTRVDNSLLVVECRFSLNLNALTIEQVVGKRHKLIKDMCDNLQLEVDLFVQSHPQVDTVLRKVAALADGETFR